MEAERWREIDALFAAALELAPPARNGFLGRACRDDEVRRAVETLIAADERANGFLEWPALEAAGDREEPELPAGERHLFVIESLNVLARAYSDLGRHAEALERAQRSLAVAREVVGPEHSTFAESLGVVGLALHRSGQGAAAEPYLRQSLDLLRATHPEGHFRTARAEVLLGSCLGALGRHAEAELLLDRGLATLEGRFGADHPYVREAREELAAHRGSPRGADSEPG